MENKTKVFHGSDIEVIEKLYNVSKDEIINYSSNVNPLGMPTSVKKAIVSNIDALESYADRENSKLKEAISKYVDCNTNNIAIGNGVSEVMKIFIKTINPKNALIIAPTYSEYEKELKSIPSKVDYFQLKKEENFLLSTKDLQEKLKGGYDLFVICNPNNPTSTIIDIKKMEEIVSYCKENNIFVLVDETYIEFVKEYKSSILLVANSLYDNLIVLRGVSKFFALPGIRFGYGITNNEQLLEKVLGQINTWSVNSLVEPSFIALSEDIEYIKSTNELMDTERKKALDKLSKIKDLRVVEPKANFILIEILNVLTSSELFELAIKEKFMIRNCESFVFLDDKYFRFCLLNPEENDILLEFLGNVFNK